MAAYRLSSLRGRPHVRVAEAGVYVQHCSLLLLGLNAQPGAGLDVAEELVALLALRVFLELEVGGVVALVGVRTGDDLVGTVVGACYLSCFSPFGVLLQREPYWLNFCLAMPVGGAGDSRGHGAMRPHRVCRQLRDAICPFLGLFPFARAFCRPAYCAGCAANGVSAVLSPRESTHSQNKKGAPQKGCAQSLRELSYSTSPRSIMESATFMKPAMLAPFTRFR